MTTPTPTTATKGRICMKQKILIVILIISLGVAGYTFYIAWRMQDPQYQRQRTLGADEGMIDMPGAAHAAVDLDAFAAKRPRQEGTREIVPPAAISFVASIREAPQEITTQYLQEAFGVLGLSPAPQVHYRMFIETAQGHIMPVYVWDEVAEAFTAGDAPLKLRGYHVYTYAKGPAIVVDGEV